jgi:hypothetical protein
MTTHRERCERECTRDVVFVFQRRRVFYTAEPSGYEHDGEGWTQVLDEDGEPLEGDQSERPYLTDDEMLEMECAIAAWETEGVWLDRDEAEAFGVAHHYNYGKGRNGTDWRVYGMPSYGDLAVLLRSQDGESIE